MPDTLSAASGAELVPELANVPGSVDPGAVVLKRGPVAGTVASIINFSKPAAIKEI